MVIFLAFATENDKSKFEELFERYKKLLLYKAYSILGDYSLAEDAVSEAFIRIYKNLAKIEDTESPRTISFLVTIVKNTSLTILQKQKNNASIEAYTESEDSGYNTEETVLSGTVTREMLELVGKLKEDLRAPFLLKYAHGLSHREIADALRISENNATVRIHRAKSKLVKMFREAGYANEKQ